MGQISNPIVLGFSVLPIDRETGPGADGGATGNRIIMLGALAGRNSTISDAVLIGNNAGSGGYTSAGLNGSVNVGSNSFLPNVDAVTDLNTGLQGSLINVGSFNFPLLTAGARMAGTVLIGSGIANLFVGDAAGSNDANNVLIGDNVWQGNAVGAGVGCGQNVFIGYLAGQCTQSVRCQFLNTVVIGNRSGAYTSAAAGSLSATVCIGAGSMNNVQGGNSGHTVIGSGSGNSIQNATNNTLIGASVNCSGSTNTIVGMGSLVTGGSSNTILGASNAHTSTGNRNIILGFTADNDLATAASDQLIIGTLNGATQQTIAYADLTKGNIVLGQSTLAANRDFGGAGSTNVLKLLNGTSGGVNPIGGGYFYVTGGTLHWVSSGGTDTTLSLNATGQLASSAVAYTNNAAAAAGTLLNAPVAGNPTKWIPINDAGTIRNVPAW